jgi:hypothetical protein
MADLNRPAASEAPCIVRDQSNDDNQNLFGLYRPGKGILTLAEIKSTLADLVQAMERSRKTARFGKMGQPENDAMFDLLEIAFQLWVNFVDQPFTLVWGRDNSPDTAAAQWSVDVARVVDPDVLISHVMTAARKVKERSIKISRLDELPAFTHHFFKRSGWAE